MDQVMVNLGASSNAKTGDDVTFIGVDAGEEISAWDIADKLGTIPYEVCCAISDRVPRIYC
jgi:alanine racemase